MQKIQFFNQLIILYTSTDISILSATADTIYTSIYSQKTQTTVLKQPVNGENGEGSTTIYAMGYMKYDGRVSSSSGIVWYSIGYSRTDNSYRILVSMTIFFIPKFKVGRR